MREIGPWNLPTKSSWDLAGYGPRIRNLMTKDDSQETEQTGRIDWSKKHLWQIQCVRDLLLLFAVLGLLLLGERLSLVTVPALLALLFAYLFEPLIVWLCRISKVTRRFASGGIVVATVMLIVIPILIGMGFGILQGATFAKGLAKRTGAVIASVESPNDAGLEADVGGGAWLAIRDYFVELQPPSTSAAKELAQEETPGGSEDTDAKSSADASTGPANQSEAELSILGIDRTVIAKGVSHAMKWLRDNADQTAKTVLGTSRGALTVAVSTISSVGVLLFGAFLTAFFFFFISGAWPGVVADGKALIPAEDRAKWLAIIAKMDRAVHGFVRGRLTIAFILAGFYTIGFWLIGVPAPLIAGPAVALLALIPYAALLVVPVVMAFLWLENQTGMRGTVAWVILAPIALYQIGQALDDYVLTPLIQGKSTNLDTPTILFASIAGGILLGFFGLLVAIPLAACTKILFHEVFWPRVQAWLRGHAKDPIPLDH